MIGFFRRIRRRLANENQFIKYSRYAVGEIVLVMVGILLALQVNIWNEERKRVIKATSALESLKEDLLIQQELIEEQMDYEEDKIETVNIINEHLKTTLNYKGIDSLLVILAERHTFITIKSTFKNIEDSGGLIFLKNLKLQNSIVRYFQKLDYTATVINNNNLFLVDNQYGEFYLSNPLGLSLNSNSDIYKLDNLQDEQRYLLHINLINRRNISQSMFEIIVILKQQTRDLLEQLTLFLEK